MTPVVIGIIVGTVGVFVVVLCALFYCVKLENERSLRIKDDNDNEDDKIEAQPRTSEDGDGRAMHVANDDDKDDDDDDDNDDQTLGRGRRPPSSTVATEGVQTCAEEVVVGVAVEKRGLFKWVGKKGAGTGNGGEFFLFTFSFRGPGRAHIVRKRC